MRLIDNQIYAHWEDMLSCGLAEDYVKVATHRYRSGQSKSWENMPDPTDARKVLIKLDTLPKSTKGKFIDSYGKKTLEAWANDAARQQLADRITKEDADVAYFSDVKGTGGLSAYTDTEVEQLARSAAWMRYLGSLPRKKSEIQQHGYSSKSALMRAAHDQAVKIERLCGLSNLKNHRKFLDKVKGFRDNGLTCLVNGRIGNSNRLKLTDEVQEFLKMQYSRHNKYAFTQVWDMYMAEAAIKGWEEISLSTVKRYLSQPDVKILCGYNRQGSKEWQKSNSPTFDRRPASYPHAMWIMDGSPIELYYEHEGKRYMRMYGFMVMDACTWNIIGYSLSKTETSETVFRALKNAATNTGYLPMQLLMDNSSAIKSTDMMKWYSDFTKYVTPAAPGNARAKKVEPGLKHFNEHVLRHYPNYSGAGVEASQDNKVNQEWLIKHKNDIPTQEEAIIQIAQAVAEWNRKHPLEGKSKSRELTFALRMKVFWQWRMKSGGEQRQTYAYKQEGLVFQHGGKKRKYVVYDKDGVTDYDFWKHNAGLRFNVKYDADDWSMIALYDGDKFVTYAEQKKRMPEAIVDREEGEGEYIMKEITARKRFAKEVKGEARVIEERIEAEGVAKFPFAQGNRIKDGLNQAKEIIKTDDLRRSTTPKRRKSHYLKESKHEIIED